MYQKARVVENPRKGDFWDVMVTDDTDNATIIKTELPYAQAYQEKLAAEKRVAAGQLVVRRKPMIVI